MTLKFDPEFLAWREAMNIPVRPVFDDPLVFRGDNNKFLNSVFSIAPYPAAVERSNHTVTSKDGTSVTVTRFATAAQRAAATTADSAPLPAVVFAFGGGLISGSVDIWTIPLAADVLSTGVQFFAVEYRLAPEHQAPAGVEDFYAATAWVSSNAAALGIDPARIAVAGASAGGCIAAGGALLARDRGLSSPLAKQVLIYPMLDDRTCTRVPADDPLHPFLTWSLHYNKMGWGAYLGADKAGKPEADVSPYAAPGRAEEVAGLPSTYIDVGNLDLFRDEDIAYAARLAAAHVDVEFHVYSGVPHGFEAAQQSAVAKSARENRIRAYRSF